jgi:hypothetical protein
MKPCCVANRESRLLVIGVAAEAFEQTLHGTRTDIVEYEVSARAP